MDKYEEMIIRIDQTVIDLNESIKEDSKSNIKAHDEILLKIDEQRKCINNQSSKFIQSKLFYWVMGFIVLGVFTVAGIASNNYNSIGKIETQIEKNIEE
jgi:hypothetical protein